MKQSRTLNNSKTQMDSINLIMIRKAMQNKAKKVDKVSWEMPIQIIIPNQHLAMLNPESSHTLPKKRSQTSIKLETTLAMA